MTAGDIEYSSLLGRKGWLWGNCRLFAQARQCCVCLLLRSLASWLPLHCHRNNGQTSSWGKIYYFLLCFFPLIFVCSSTISLLQQHCAKWCYTRSQLQVAPRDRSLVLAARVLLHWCCWGSLLPFSPWQKLLRDWRESYSCLSLPRLHCIQAGESFLLHNIRMFSSP